MRWNRGVCLGGKGMSIERWITKQKTKDRSYCVSANKYRRINNPAEEEVFSHSFSRWCAYLQDVAPLFTAIHPAIHPWPEDWKWSNDFCVITYLHFNNRRSCICQAIIRQNICKRIMSCGSAAGGLSPPPPWNTTTHSSSFERHHFQCTISLENDKRMQVECLCGKVTMKRRPRHTPDHPKEEEGTQSCIH